MSELGLELAGDRTQENRTVFEMTRLGLVLGDFLGLPYIQTSLPSPSETNISAINMNILGGR